MDVLQEKPSVPAVLRDAYAAWDWQLAYQYGPEIATYRLAHPRGEVRFLKLAEVSLAQQLDEIIISQLYHFRHQSVGQLGVSPTRALVTQARNALNKQRVPTQNRRLLVTPNTETALLNIDSFVEADKLGDP
ncbi:MAG: hypothetical protein ACE10G_09825, partial [Gemmatimonadales bacterium]